MKKVKKIAAMIWRVFFLHFLLMFSNKNSRARIKKLVMSMEFFRKFAILTENTTNFDVTCSAILGTVHCNKNISKSILPKNSRLTKRAEKIMKTLPKINIVTKSAVLPRNEFSSNIRQYRYVKIMLKKKLKPNVPRVCEKMSCEHSEIIVYIWRFVTSNSSVHLKIWT